MRSLITRFGAPLVLMGGVAGIMGVQRGAALKHSLEHLADSLSRGAGPMEVSLPLVPAYLDGDRIGRLASVRLERHQPRTVDSLELRIELSHPGSAATLKQCAIELSSFDLEDYKEALQCADGTDGLAPFGHVEITGTGDRLVLYVPAEELACPPWVERSQPDCIAQRVQGRVRLEVDRARAAARQAREVRRQIRATVR